MIWLNKTLKFIALTIFRLATGAMLAILALLTTSPIMSIALCIMDAIGTIPAMVQGKYFICWLIVSSPFFLGYNLYTDIKARLPKHKKN